VLVCEGDLTITGNVNFNHGQIYAEQDVIINPGGSLSMSSADDALIVNGDLIVNSTSNVSLGNGYLDLKGDLAINSAVNFTTHGNVNAQFSGASQQTVSYQSGKTVMFGKLAFTGDDPSHVTVYNGASYVNVASIYTTYGTLYSLEEILTEVVKVEWEFVEVPQAMISGTLGGNGASSILDGIKAKFSSWIARKQCYIFYDPNAGGDNFWSSHCANGMIGQLKRAYRTKIVFDANVTLIDMEDMAEEGKSFEDAWEDMADGVAMVVLIGHGNVGEFRIRTGILPDKSYHTYIDSNFISNLADKNIETVFIAGCQTRNPNVTTVGGDIASSFLLIPGVESVVAFDGICNIGFNAGKITRFYCGDEVLRNDWWSGDEDNPNTVGKAEGVVYLTANANGSINSTTLFEVGGEHIFYTKNLCEAIKEVRR
jgi:hypothetical protein